MNTAFRCERLSLRYALVAVADPVRGARCVEALAPFRIGALVPRTSDEALTTFERFGAPTLLITDLSLPPRDGFFVVEAARALLPRHLPVIGISEFTSLRTYAEGRVDLRFDALLPGTASIAELSDIVRRLLGQVRTEAAPARELDVVALMREAADDTVRITRARGAVVYLRVADHEQFRAHVSWTSEGSAGCPFSPPELFEWVRQARDAILLPDLASTSVTYNPSAIFQQVVRGIVAAPVMDSRDAVIGTVCGFDVRPLSLGTLEVDALRSLGYRIGRAIGPG